MTAPAHERLFRSVLNDPNATPEQKLQAAKRLEKSVLERKKLRAKARKEVQAEEQAAEAAEEQPDFSFLDKCATPECPNKTTDYAQYCDECQRQILASRVF